MNILTEWYRNSSVLVFLVYVTPAVKSCCSNVSLWSRGSFLQRLLSVVCLKISGHFLNLVL